MQARDRLPVYPDLAGKVAVVTGGSGGWWPIAHRFVMAAPRLGGERHCLSADVASESRLPSTGSRLTS
jgi:hypothetical protein